MNFAIDNLPVRDQSAEVNSRISPQNETASTSVSSPNTGIGQVRTYVVQPGDSVRSVCQKVGQPFDLVRSLNSHAVRQASDGRWYFIAGQRIEVPADFQSALAAADQSLAGAEPTPATDPAESGPPPFSPSFDADAGAVSNRDQIQSSSIQELGSLRSPMSPETELALGLTRSVRPVQEAPAGRPLEEQPNVMLKFILNF